MKDIFRLINMNVFHLQVLNKNWWTDEINLLNQIKQYVETPSCYYERVLVPNFVHVYQLLQDRGLPKASTSVCVIPACCWFWESARNIPHTAGTLCSGGDAELWTFGHVRCGVWTDPTLGRNTGDPSVRLLTGSTETGSPFSPVPVSESPLPERESVNRLNSMKLNL